MNKNLKHFNIYLSVFLVFLSGFGVWMVQSYEKKQFHPKAALISSKPIHEEPSGLKEIIHETQKRVVQIETSDGLGSGFLYDNKGHIVTNAHVVANAKEVTIRTTDNQTFDGIVIGISGTEDVAVVRADGLKGMTPLPINKKLGETGDDVLALGSPLGLQNTVTTGIISGTGRNFTLEPFVYNNVYQFSAPIAPGNSGGPLVDRKTGEVLGINSVTANEGDIGFSIPIPNVSAMINQWISKPMQELPAISQSLQTEEGETETFSEEELAEYLVSYFYDSVSQGDYVTAYSLLGSAWQKETSYELFRDGYLATLSVTLDDITVSGDNGNFSVEVWISALERGQNTAYQAYHLTYQLGYENDVLKILSGSGEEQ
jgi:serine protease Do